MQKLYIRCGKLYPGYGKEVFENQTIVVEQGLITAVANTAELCLSPDVIEYDYSADFVIPGLIDTHCHLSYANAKTQESIDLYANSEFRALRGLFFAQQALASGVTFIVVPGSTGSGGIAVRDIIDTGLFQGPRITASAQYLTNHQSLTHFYPSWMGVPPTSIGVFTPTREAAIQEIRKQVKDGVDAVKLALDGFQRRSNGDVIAAFTLDEVKAMVDEIHRLDKIAIAHATGREAIGYAAKAGVDLIFHGSQVDDQVLKDLVDNGCSVSPSFTMPRNAIDFIRPGDPGYELGIANFKRGYDRALQSARRIREAGVPMPIGSEAGFAATPYGEWHAKELQIYVEDIGFSPLEALEQAGAVTAKVVRPSDKVGRIAEGHLADLLVLDGDPVKDIRILQRKEKRRAVIQGGRQISAPAGTYHAELVSDFAQVMFRDLYTQDRVRELGIEF